MTEVEFFFDIASPYSYLAATQIREVAKKHQAHVRWRPMLLGAVFKAAANTMPASVPAKATYMLGDLYRWAEMYGVGFTFPKSFPANTVKAMRACVVGAEHDKAAEMALALFEQHWVHDRDPSSAEALVAAAKSAGLDGDALLAAIETQPVKDQLRAHTDEAVKRGVFGAPTFFVGDVMLWGNDRLPMLEHILSK